jgi:hypothetical protein
MDDVKLALTSQLMNQYDILLAPTNQLTIKRRTDFGANTMAVDSVSNIASARLSATENASLGEQKFANPDVA